MAEMLFTNAHYNYNVNGIVGITYKDVILNMHVCYKVYESDGTTNINIETVPFMSLVKPRIHPIKKMFLSKQVTLCLK